MAKLNEIITYLEQVSRHPADQLRKYLAEGKQVVGCFPIYTPEVLADAAGIVPMGLWGGQMETLYSKRYLVSFACPIMHSCMELGLTGKYNGIKAVMIPAMCDTFRCITQDFKAGVKDIACIPFTPPQNRVMEAAKVYLVEEYKQVQERLEEVYGVKISEENVQRSIAVYNRHNAAMRRFAELANDHLDVITPVVRHAVFKSAWFMPKAEHLELMEELNRELSIAEPYEYKGKRVILTGITAEPDNLLEILQQNGLAVVGDDLAQETRQYRTDIPDGSFGLRQLAEQWCNRIDPMAHAERFQRTEVLLDLCRKNEAKAVIVCLMKFCDPEEYEYVAYAPEVKEAGYPVLSIDIDQQPAGYDQARTRIQTLAELM